MKKEPINQRNTSLASPANPWIKLNGQSSNRGLRPVPQIQELVSVSSDATFCDFPALLRAFPRLLKTFNVKRIMDAPCGDFKPWLHTNFGPAHFIGADIVPNVIIRNQKTYSNNRRTFTVLNLLRDAIPQVDLLMVRRLLLSLCYQDFWQVIDHIYASGSKYLLTETFPEWEGNDDVETGEWRPFNLVEAPFNFPDPILLIREPESSMEGWVEEKCYGIWRIDSLPVP